MSDIRGRQDKINDYPLSKGNHGSHELHRIGQSLLDPTFVAPIPYSATGTVGLSDEVARADHVHGFPQAAIDAINAGVASGANGDALYNQANTPVNFESFQPLRFNSVVANLGSGARFFYYLKQGPMVDFFCHWVVANDSAYGTGPLQLWIPVGLNNVSFDVPCGHARLLDGSTGYHAMPIAISSGAGYTVFQLINDAMSWYATNPTPPFAWGTGDSGRVYGRFYGA